MSYRRFRTLIAVAIALMVLAILFPALMVIRVINANVPLSLFSYALSVSGLGIAVYAIAHRVGGYHGGKSDLE